jgi:TetR/AcrR family transcriptional repressor of nem operon
MKKTEKLLIDITFDILYKKGYCATSLMDILKIAKITKGAMYYHFESKSTLVLASMKYYLDQILETHWVTPLAESDEPIETLIGQINLYLNMFADEENFLDIKHGCPLINFVLDMSDKDEALFTYLQSVYSHWHDSVEKALAKAQKLGHTKTDFTADDQALFIISSIEGCIGTAKAYNRLSALQKNFQVLTSYIQRL